MILASLPASRECWKIMIITVITDLASLALFSASFDGYSCSLCKTQTTRTHLRKNSIENHITTIISITNNRAIALSSYSWIVEKTLKAKHVNTIKKLKWDIRKSLIKYKTCWKFLFGRQRDESERGGIQLMPWKIHRNLITSDSPHARAWSFTHIDVRASLKTKNLSPSYMEQLICLS